MMPPKIILEKKFSDTTEEGGKEEDINDRQHATPTFNFYSGGQQDSDFDETPTISFLPGACDSEDECETPMIKRKNGLIKKGTLGGKKGN